MLCSLCNKEFKCNSKKCGFRMVACICFSCFLKDMSIQTLKDSLSDKKDAIFDYYYVKDHWNLSKKEFRKRIYLELLLKR